MVAYFRIRDKLIVYRGLVHCNISNQQTFLYQYVQTGFHNFTYNLVVKTLTQLKNMIGYGRTLLSKSTMALIDNSTTALIETR